MSRSDTLIRLQLRTAERQSISAAHQAAGETSDAPDIVRRENERLSSRAIGVPRAFRRATAYICSTAYSVLCPRRSVDRTARNIERCNGDCSNAARKESRA